MKAIISPSRVRGTVSAPPSKSYTHRAVILASLADGISHIQNPLLSDDTLCTIDCLKSLGTSIDQAGNRLKITGVSGRFPKSSNPVSLFCGLSGTTMRLMTAVAALSDNEIILDGEDKLRKRPMKDLLIALKESRINIESVNKNNQLPICVKGGEFRGGTISVSGNTSSQFISALLLISPFAKSDTTLIVDDLKSKPYVDITIDLMKTFGVKVKAGKGRYFIKSGQRYESRNYTVEGDYSSASYFFAAEKVTHSEITIANLNPDSVQGDKYFLEILKKMKENRQQKISFNLGNYPDIVPTVAICAATFPFITEITNIGHLQLKETNRIKALDMELKKMKVKVKSTDNKLRVQGPALNSEYPSFVGSQVDTFNDHRIAMSFAIAGLVADGKTVINSAEVVNKSYPNFWQDLKKIGANIEILS